MKKHLVLTAVFAGCALLLSSCGQPTAQAAEKPKVEDLQKAADEGKLKQVNLKVEGMTCASCENAVQSALAKVPGVKGSKVSAKDGEATVFCESDNADAEKLAAAVTSETSYKASVK